VPCCFLGVDEATALVITDTQQAGLQPPTYAFAPAQKKSSPVSIRTFSFNVSVERQLSSELERQTTSTRKDKQNAIHGHRQSQVRAPKTKAQPPIPSSWPQVDHRISDNDPSSRHFKGIIRMPEAIHNILISGNLKKTFYPGVSGNGHGAAFAHEKHDSCPKNSIPSAAISARYRLCAADGQAIPR
jgi:hypothetical protein